MGEGLAENVRILSYGRGSKIAQKNRHMIFEHSLMVIILITIKEWY